MQVDFEVISQITSIQVMAVGNAIRELPMLRKRFGRGRWRKLKGVARVRLHDGTTRIAELHWHEAHGIGRKRMKVKRYVD